MTPEQRTFVRSLRVYGWIAAIFACLWSIILPHVETWAILATTTR